MINFLFSCREESEPFCFFCPSSFQSILYCISSKQLFSIQNDLRDFRSHVLRCRKVRNVFSCVWNQEFCNASSNAAIVRHETMLQPKPLLIATQDASSNRVILKRTQWSLEPHPDASIRTIYIVRKEPSKVTNSCIITDFVVWRIVPWKRQK